MSSLVEWARIPISLQMYSYYRTFMVFGLNHWSRQFEYPWIMEHGRFRTNELVLDAGGGNECCQLQYVLADRNCHVTNLDIDVNQFSRTDPRILYTIGDIHNIPHLDEIFSRVICVSVLEHLQNPHKALSELWRVLAPGGRLLVTMDVADRVLENSNPDLRHGITEDLARNLLKSFNLEVPPLPEDIIKHTLTVDNVDLQLKVLCFYIDKPVKE